MHVFFMSIFAAIVATIVAIIDPERHETRTRVLYGLKVFGAFVGIGILLGWLMRFVPF
jgi:hypothetical protein